MILDGSNKISRAFSCGLKDNETPFCIEAGTSKYDSNISLLQSSALWNGTCTDLSST